MIAIETAILFSFVAGFIAGIASAYTAWGSGK